MNPLVSKVAHVALVILTAVAAAGPVVAKLAGVVPPAVLSELSGLIALAGTVVAFATGNPLLTGLLAAGNKRVLARKLDEIRADPTIRSVK